MKRLPAAEPDAEHDEDRKIYAAIALLGLVMRDPRQIVNPDPMCDEAVAIGNGMARALKRTSP